MSYTKNIPQKQIEVEEIKRIIDKIKTKVEIITSEFIPKGKFMIINNIIGCHPDDEKEVENLIGISDKVKL